MTAKQELIAAAWRANPTVTAVQIVEIIKAGGTDVSKSAVDNMKKELGLVATGQRGRKKANPQPTAEAKADTPSTEQSRPEIVFTAPSALPEWIDGANATIATTASVMPVAPVKARKPKKKAKKAKPKSFAAPAVSTPVQFPTLAAPEPFDVMVKQYATSCIDYMSHKAKLGGYDKSFDSYLKSAYAALGISLS